MLFLFRRIVCGVYALKIIVIYLLLRTAPSEGYHVTCLVNYCLRSLQLQCVPPTWNASFALRSSSTYMRRDSLTGRTHASANSLLRFLNLFVCVYKKYK